MRDDTNTNVLIYKGENHFSFPVTFDPTCCTPSEELRNLALFLKEQKIALLETGRQIILNKPRYEQPYLEVADFRITTSPKISDSPFTLFLMAEGKEYALMVGIGYAKVADILNRLVEANPTRYK